MSAADALHAQELRPGQGGPAVSASGDLAWRILILLNVFRIALGLLLLAIFVLIGEPRIVGGTHPPLGWAVLLGMIGFGTAELLLLSRRIGTARAHTYFQFALDVTLVTTLIHASGGVSSGLGGVLIVSVGALSLLLPGDRAFLFAAVSALAILGEQSLSHMQGITDSAQYAPAGILGAVIFVITAVVQLLRRRIVETEALAEQRGVDLRNLAELNEYIIQHLRESIVVIDDDDCVRLINESAAGHLGAPAASAGQPIAAISPELAVRLKAWRDDATSEQHPPNAFASSDGSTSIRPHFARLGQQRTGGVLAFLEDTSLIAERVQQTKLAALGRLSASIAHEIRNPLGAMSHAGQLLAESDHIGPDDRRLTDIIRLNARRVSQIVDSVLSLTRREKARPRRLRIAAWVDDFTREFVSTLELYEDSVRAVALDPDLEVDMDPTHLHQVVWNLCDNAVKYASATAGAIAIELSCGRLEGSGRPYLEIADRGPGIAEDKVEQIFEPFYTGQPGGTGLGLYISRELCERNGATLRYQPRPGGGSLFRIVFADPARWQLAEGIT
jgi:two-component system, NtrC family, sensor histidine kinase PilS